MADSPNIIGDGTVKITIYSEGKAIAENIALLSILISKKINKIPYAKITFIDGDMPNGDFPLSNADTFAPGKLIKINAGYGQKEETLFEGIVVKHGISISKKNSSQLEVEIKDKAIKMTVGRKNATFTKAKDSDIISKLISSCNGLSAQVDSTPTTNKQIVQYYATDWDFILTRAEINGLLVITDSGKITVKKPATSEAPVLTVTYGVDLMDFKADVDAATQLTAVKSTAWNLKEQKITEQSGTAPSLNKQGDLTSSTLAKVIGLDSYQLQCGIPIEDTSLKSWADARLLKAGLSMICGSMKIQGTAKALPGKIIEIKGLGKHFCGNVFVSSVQHTFAEGNWVSEIHFGLSDEWFSQSKQMAAPPASGLLPPVEGLQIGLVQKLDGDPDGELRIQVTCPLLGAKAEPIWARLATFYGLNQFGAFFIPEIGSEVILGFFNNDPSFPVVLGNLYCSKNKAPYELTADNYTKAIVTKSKLKLTFDDEKKITTIETPGGNKIVISDEAKSILLTDQNKNKIELNSDGIALDSPKDIKITSKAKISLNGTGGIELASNADVKISGLNINQTANASYTAKGSATAEVSASGTTTIKGAMVMIN